MNKLITLDKPQNPEIQINQETNAEVPQAWEYEWNWYYNRLGAMAEAKHRGLHLPSYNEFDKLEDELKKLNQFNGFRAKSGSFYGLGSYGYWWSSTESGSTSWYRSLVSGYSTVFRGTYGKRVGFSVVCTEKPLYL